MARLLIDSKLYVPKVQPGLVVRPRLLERLRRGADARLTLVSAPAGFGKTTLLAEWLRAAAGDDRSVAWLSLDPADDEPASFWTYVVTALQRAVPGVGSTALELLGASPLPTDLVLTTVLNELAAVPHEVWLVLDDYHLVRDRAIGEGMAFLLDHLPGQVHVVLVTRADPHLPLARWRGRGELVEIRAADLRFTVDEVTAYLHGVTGLELAPEDVAVLEERTEGWIAALQLAALSIQGRKDVGGFIARFAGDDRYIVDYLVEEVLRHQSDAVRGFLLQTSVLDRMTGPLCDALTGRGDGSDMLLALERANLFIVALDDRRQWFRYHHLFGDLLRARMLSDHPDRLPSLHQRASRWYEDQQLPEEAVGHALAARDFDRAAHLMELAVPAIRRRRQETLMHGWLQALPDAAVRHSPVLSVFYGSMLMVSGDLDAVEPRLDDADRALAAVPDGETPPWADTDELHTLPATIAIYRASIAQARGDVVGTQQHARHALELAGPDDHLARGGASGFLGLAAWAEGNVAGALDTFSQAVASLRAAGNVVDELSSTVVLADLWIASGRPSTARRLCEQALQRAQAHGAPVARAAAELHVGLSEIDVAAGDLHGAQGHLEAAAALADRAPMTESRYRWFVAKGLLARADGDPEAALDLWDQAQRLYRRGFFPDVRPIAATRARIWIAQGRLPEAADWVQDRGVSATDKASYLSEYDHLTLVRLRLAQHRAHPDTSALVAVTGLLERLDGAAERAGRAGSLLEIRILQALAQEAQGRRPEASAALARALLLAPEPGGYVPLFLDEGAPMMGLLRDVTQRDGAGRDVERQAASDVARRLMGLVPANVVSSPDSGPGSPASTELLSERELQVLRLLDSELSAPEIARQLFVSHNTVRTHTKHIFTKLDVTNRRAAVRRAHELGLS